MREGRCPESEKATLFLQTRTEFPLNSSQTTIDRAAIGLLWTVDENVSSLRYCLPDFRPKWGNHLNVMMGWSDNLGKPRFVSGLSELISQSLLHSPNEVVTSAPPRPLPLLIASGLLHTHTAPCFPVKRELESYFSSGRWHFLDLSWPGL